MKRIKDWEELTIQDNFLFQKVMRNKRLCQHLIEKILQIKIADITYPDTEKTIDIRLDSKSVRLDVYVKDETGRVYDIEMQCENEANNGLAKRTRYYQGIIDMELLNKGDVYDNLKPSYIVYYIYLYLRRLCQGPAHVYLSEPLRRRRRLGAERRGDEDIPEQQGRQRDAGPGCAGVFEIRRRKGGGGGLCAGLGYGSESYQAA